MRRAPGPRARSRSAGVGRGSTRPKFEHKRLSFDCDESKRDGAERTAAAYVGLPDFTGALCARTVLSSARAARRSLCRWIHAQDLALLFGKGSGFVHSHGPIRTNLGFLDKKERNTKQFPRKDLDFPGLFITNLGFSFTNSLRLTNKLFSAQESKA